MSHVVYLVRHRDHPVDEERFIGSLLAGGGWHGSVTGLRYQNRDTGVTAALEPDDPPSLPGGYASVGTSLVLHYARPSFWALEVLPSVVNAAMAAGLLFMDPESGDAPVEPDEDRIRHSWDAGNRAAVGAARDAGAELPWIAPDKADRWWAHQRALPQLRLGFAPDHYVPSLRFVRREDSNEVQRAMSWPDFVPALMPECDVVILLRSVPRRTFEIRGVANADEVQRLLEPILDHAEMHLPETKQVSLLASGRSEDASCLLARLPLAPFEGLADVAPDELVDVPPPGT